MSCPYEEAKKMRDALESYVADAGMPMKAFPRGTGPMGSTPDHVKFSSEFKTAKARYDAAFAELRKFNGWFVKQFKSEILAERRAKYEVKS